MNATCHTPGCFNAGAAIDIGDPPTDDDGQPVQPWTVLCGVCGQPIDDLSEKPVAGDDKV